MWSFFSAGAYDGFDAQNSKNFFKVYGDLFRELDKEEELEEMEGTNHEVPLFGNVMSAKEEVFAFYEYWQHFSTLK
jgi:hypothetical protein